jgi:hypothetical protein
MKECQGRLCTGHIGPDDTADSAFVRDSSAFIAPSASSANTETASGYLFVSNSTAVAWNSDGTVTYTDPDGTVSVTDGSEYGDN